jgi:hypothetical protein
MCDEPVPVMVVETPEFLASTRKLMSPEERAALVDYLALHPADGDLIPGTGGVRKLRWALAGRTKRCGTRVVYFFRIPGMPLFALTSHGRNLRAELTERDRSDFKELTGRLAAHCEGWTD